jgi:hypothetical protein
MTIQELMAAIKNSPDGVVRIAGGKGVLYDQGNAYISDSEPLATIMVGWDSGVTMTLGDHCIDDSFRLI